MLSHAPFPETVDVNLEEDIALHVHLVQSSQPDSIPKLEEIRDETTKDQSLRDTNEITKRGWPEIDKASVTSKYSHLLRRKGRTL